MDVCFLGGYDRGYPRNAVLRRGLALAGASVSECHIRPGYKFWLRYPRLTAAWLARTPQRRTDFIIVPEFCQKDVPLARLLGSHGPRRVIFDPLASRFETKIVDWGWRSAGSLAAWYNRRIDTLAFCLSDLVLVDTKAHRDYYMEFFRLPAGRFAVIPVGFDDRIFSRDLARAGQAARAARPAGSPFTAVFFGSFLPLHGVEFIIEAARVIWERDKGVRFLLIGGGRTFPGVKARAAELGLGNIDFADRMSPAALAGTVAARADVCLGIFGLTEKADRVVPHKVFQSMALGKPVVTARSPAVEEFFTHGRDVFLCDKTRPGSLAEAILALKGDAGLRESIARRAHDLAWERFQPAALGAELMGVLEPTLGTGPRRGQVRAGDRPQAGTGTKIFEVEARPIELGGYRGLIAAAYDDAAFLAALTPPEAVWSRPGIEVLHEGRNRIGRLRLTLSTSAPVDVIVKEFSTRGVNKLKSLVITPKARRAWRGAAALVERGLGTARPAACLALRKRGFVERSFFLAERIDDAVEVRGLFRDLPAARLEPLLDALAAFLRACHAGGILHRDLSDGNILARRGSAGEFEFFLLDTNRIRVRRRIGRLARVKNLIRLGIPAAHRDYFLTRYFGGEPPALARSWYEINKSVFTNYIALKRRLRLRRVARALRIQ